MNKKQKIIAGVCAGVIVGLTTISIGVLVGIGNNKSVFNSNNNNESSSNKPIASPSTYFIWEENKITELSDLGKQQTSLVLPEKTKFISNNVFANNETLESVDMSLTSITTIPNGDANTGLFYGCKNLKSVILPSNLETLGYSTFRQCENLMSINLPIKLKNISDRLFYNCTKLNAVYISSTNLESVGEYAFYNCNSLSFISLPDTVTSIGQEAFNGCKKLNSITLPDSIKNIGIGAFTDCSNLSKIELPRSLKSISYYIAYLPSPTQQRSVHCLWECHVGTVLPTSTPGSTVHHINPFYLSKS